MKTTEEEVNEIVKDYLDAEHLTLETRLVEDLGADSLDLLEIKMELENGFDVQIPDESFGQLKTVGDIVALIKTAIQEG